MRKLSRPAWLVGALVLAAGIAWGQQPQDFSKVEIKVTKVSGNVYMLEGSGGNIAASLGDDGILMVDTEYAPLAGKIQAALKGIGITNKPVRFVVNTHYHGDHSDGNAAFADAGATILANENLRRRLEEGSSIGNGPGGSINVKQAPQPKDALPTITYDRGVDIYLNGEKIEVEHMPAAHTDGDSVVFFSTNRVLHMGDIFVRYGFPFIDLNGGGSVQGMIAACDKALAEFPPDTKVIPGHGALATMDDLRDYVKMLKDTTAAVQKALTDGKSLSQMKQEKILGPWQKYSGNFVNSDAFLEEIYNSLMARKTETKVLGQVQQRRAEGQESCPAKA
ncbi:MAG TPA: MBL fold metallo-hydrolase [Candidatus Acidoferrales bacterium]|jgi:glyoxylase-like metal-dependent hydrolase (beta-lactamase superfamily II)|nr:MBL fold metallo-hydrolase [Candidatus Acidoferrales bacterium]